VFVCVCVCERERGCMCACVCACAYGIVSTVNNFLFLLITSSEVRVAAVMLQHHLKWMKRQGQQTASLVPLQSAKCQYAN
jgi:hypothetical protein